jgi:hypothetical protein
MDNKRDDMHFFCNFFSKNRKGQVTIFIIIAIIIVAAVVIFLVLRGNLISNQIPASIQPVYNNFLSCLEDKTQVGIDILESQAGYIELPDAELGSYYMPFSSQLNFLGNPVPYWYYVSGSNIQREQVPSLNDMENDLEKFVEYKIKECDLESFYAEGFEVVFGEPKADISIGEDKVSVSLDMPLTITKGEDTAYVKNHDSSVDSDFGGLYDSAVQLYDYEQETLFLEEYAVDTMRIYAPVDGVELTCSPLVWNANNVFDDLAVAIEQNTLSLKTKDGDYSLNNPDNKYYVVDVSTGYNVRFINSRNWSNVFEVSPSDSGALIAEPLGNQQGLGILGFCYVPYHFVYNLAYPVLIQVEKGDEIFQFPVVVVVQGNVPREALDVNAVGITETALCQYMETPVEVNVYDNNLNYLDSKISYKCLESTCEVGETKSAGPVNLAFPQCVNGYVVANAEGYKEGEVLFSSVNGGTVEVLLDKLYEKEINLKIGGKDYNGEAIIIFKGEDSSQTVVYPGQKKVNLSEGQYEVQVSVYRNSSLKIGETTQTQCIDILRSGVGGILGLTKEKCFDITLPPQIISNVLSAGGTQDYYLLESELTKSNIIEINAPSLPSVTSLKDLQENYVLFDENKLDIYFK